MARQNEDHGFRQIDWEAMPVGASKTFPPMSQKARTSLSVNILNAEKKTGYEFHGMSLPDGGHYVRRFS